MGGKQKQSQRVKNNARPSSSGRSAELLASSSSSFAREVRFIPPTLSILKADEFDTSVSPAFQIAFKKMNKKDCITKIKGLQEFGDLVAEAELEAVKAVVGIWATLYSILATDADHRVREAVHSAHYKVILKDKKVIAPHLKQVIGPWFTSQYDTYPPAASAAVKAFTAAFPQNKVHDCVLFCQKEILSYLLDNLVNKLDAILKQTSVEEKEPKCERVTVSMLQGFCLYLNTLTDEQIRNSSELNKEIISSAKFLSLAGHKTVIIRASWFKVLATLYNKASFLLEELQGRIVPIVFGNLDDNEPAVVGFLWEAALLIMEQVQDWWKLVNIEKHYLPKLCKVLKEGGQGSATLIYPNLLSLLHKLPPSARTDQFYDSFFENLRLGLRRKNVISSKSESTAIVTAIVECLQYVIKINVENVDLCDRLIKSHLVSLVEWGLGGEDAAYRTIFNQVALLVQTWSRNKIVKNYPRYLDIFWECLKVSIATLPDNLELTERHVVFIQYLKTTVKPREQLKVKFTSSEEGGERGKHDTHSLQTDESYITSLQNVVYVVIDSCVKQIQQNQSKALLPHLYTLVRLFEGERFLKGLSQLLIEGATLADLYDKLLHNWMTSEELNSETVIELSFLLLKYLDEDEKCKILQTFLEFDSNNAIFAWCVKNAFSYPYSRDVKVQQWLRSDQITRFLLASTKSKLLNDNANDLQALFELALTETDDKELLLDGATIENMIEELQTVLANPKMFENSIDACARTACHVTQTLYSGNALGSCRDNLLVTLFQFSCMDHSDLEGLSEDTRDEIGSTWEDILAENATQELMEKLARFLEEKFCPSAANRYVVVMVKLIRAVFQCHPLKIGEFYRLFFEREFLLPWRQGVAQLSLRGDYLWGRLTSTTPIFLHNQTVSEDEVYRYFMWTFIKIAVLESPLQDGGIDDDDIKPIIYVVDDNVDLVLTLLHDLSKYQVYLKIYKMAKYHAEISANYDVILNKMRLILEGLQIGDQIKQALLEQMKSNPLPWFKVLRLYYGELSVDTPENVLRYYDNDANRLGLCQLYSANLDFGDVQLGSSVLEDCVLLRSLAHCDEIDVQIAEVFHVIKRLRCGDVHKFLFETKDLTWGEAQTVIEVVRLFSVLVREHFDSLGKNWDFGVISLAAWASSCLKLRHSYVEEQMQALMIAVVDFYASLDGKMAELKKENAKNIFVEEWEDVFLPNIHADLTNLWMFLAEQFASKPLPVEYLPFVARFGKITERFSHKIIFAEDVASPNWSKILKRCNTLLVHSSPVLQLWGYQMLLVLVPGLIEIDLQTDLSHIPNVKGFTSEHFREVLAQTHSIVSDILSGFRLGEDSCQIAPFTDSYTYVFGYLLLWKVLLSLCERAPPELRYQYTDWLRNDDYLKSLLNNIFKLMPAEILHYSEGKSRGLLKLFAQSPNLNFEEPSISEQLEHIVCWIYTLCLSQLPALVRQWWSETESKVAQVIERVTALYVSPQLCNQELQDVARHEHKFKNMTVKTVLSVREVIAVYTVDEAHMELVISLPQNYPLVGPDVRCNRQIAGTLHKQWLMQLKKYLLHQNGRVWDGLLLWNNSLDKKFDGVEECYICFAVLHPGTYQLPKLTCQTCKKKFHSACLYKWFSTSNKSSCPICRNLF